MFLLICVIWGSTWIASKIGVAAVPPLLFCGTRFLAAGALMLALLWWRGELAVPARAHLGRLAVVTMLVIVLPYGLMFWGMRFVSSGMASILDLSILPAAMLIIGASLGEDRFTPARVAGIAVGIAGLLLLFGHKAAGTGNGGTSTSLAGGAAIVASALIYASGSVLARPLLRQYGPLQIAAATTAAGSLVLLVGSLLLEPASRHWRGWHWTPTVLAGWLFLVLFGSMVAYTAFLQLVRLWGASRASAYAFVSPIMAVILGVTVFGEAVSLTEAAGMAVMLAGAWLTLRPA